MKIKLSAKTTKTVLRITLFAIAMAFLETAVVLYIRKLYYPEGFMFPLKMISPDVALTEFLREAATLIMLIVLGVIAGRTRMERFGYFIFTFAVWDIFYYIFLYALLQWPSSLLTWDILFLIPCTWVGPVLAPVINSLCMILLFFVILFFVEKKQRCKTSSLVWILLIAGSLVVIGSYIEDYVDFMTQRFTFWQIFDLSNFNTLMDFALTYVPMDFKWWLFLTGVAMHLGGIGEIVRKNSEKQRVR